MAKNPAILQVCPMMKEGGVERSTIEMAAYISAQQWLSYVAAQSGPLTCELSPKTHFISLPLHRRDPVSTLLNAWRLTRVVKKYDITLMHARSRGPAWSAYLASRWTGVPYITTFHGTHGLKGVGKKWYNSVMVKGQKVIANSTFIQAHIERHYGISAEDIPVAPRGYDATRLNPSAISAEEVAVVRKELGLSSDIPVLVMVGRLTRWKGQHVLLEALARIQNIPWAVLFVGGTGQKEGYLNELKELAERLGIAKRVRWLGSQNNVALYYKVADLAISASTTPEAFGRVAVEAQAMGTPVIATAHGGSLETVQEGITGWLVPPENREILADTLEKALTNAAQLPRMGQQARQWVAENFTTEMTCQKEFAVYEQCIKNIK